MKTLKCGILNKYCYTYFQMESSVHVYFRSWLLTHVTRTTNQHRINSKMHTFSWLLGWSTQGQGISAIQQYQEEKVDLAIMRQNVNICCTLRLWIWFLFLIVLFYNKIKVFVSGNISRTPGSGVAHLSYFPEFDFYILISWTWKRVQGAIWPGKPTWDSSRMQIFSS